VVRIASPYFDADSARLLARLMSEAGLASHKPRLELWIDGSAMVGRPSDYKVVAELARRYGPACEIRKVVTNASGKAPARPEWLHAKVIEVQDAEGRVKRLIGSANFTGAAWLGPWNTESVQLETDRYSLEALLGRHQSVVSLSRRDIRSLCDNSEEREEDDPAERACIYWAAFDETQHPRRLSVCYKAEAAIKDFTIEASFDPERDRLDGKQQRDRIVAVFQAKSSWNELLPRLDGLLRLEFRAATSVP